MNGTLGEGRILQVQDTVLLVLELVFEMQIIMKVEKIICSVRNTMRLLHYIQYEWNICFGLKNKGTSRSNSLIYQI